MRLAKPQRNWKKTGKALAFLLGVGCMLLAWQLAKAHPGDWSFAGPSFMIGTLGGLLALAALTVPARNW